MLPWRQIREPVLFAMILLVVALGYLFVTTWQRPAPVGDSLVETPAIAGISTTVGYPPVRIATPPTSIFTPGTYTADRPNNGAVFIPRYTFIPVPPPVYKSITAQSPQTP